MIKTKQGLGVKKAAHELPFFLSEPHAVSCTAVGLGGWAQFVLVDLFNQGGALQVQQLGGARHVA